MKKYLVIIIVFFCNLILFAQKDSNEDLKNGEWSSNIEQATEKATSNNASILMVFAGSDWCRPCMQFKKEVLETSQFVKYANQKLEVLYLDFPAKKKNRLSPEVTKHNEALAEKYNRSGVFPKVVLVDANGNVLKDIAYTNQNADQFILECEQILSK